MENPILEKRKLVQSRIEKSFDSGINVPEEVEIEKAHQDGEIHPNGKWVWVSSANGGKGDWRTRGGRIHNAHSENEKKFKQNFKDAQDGLLQKIIDGKIQAVAHEKKWAQDILDERKKGAEGNKAAKKIIDLIKTSNSKYSDISKVVAFKTDKGNWAIDYDGANTGLIIGKNYLSEAELKAAGVKIEGINANSKRDSDLINDIKSNEDAFIEACGLSNIKRVISIRETSTSVFIKYENESGQEQEFPLTKNVANSVLKEVKSEKSKKAGLKDDVKAVQNITMPDLNGGSKSITLGDGRTVTVQIKNLNKGNGYVIGKISGGGSNQFKFGGASGKSVDDAFDLVKKDLIKNIDGSTKKSDPKQDGAAKVNVDKKIDDITIDQSAYDSAYKIATSKEETESHLRESLRKIDENITEVKNAMSSASSATLGKLQKMLIISVSKKKAIEDALKNFKRTDLKQDKVAQAAGFKDYEEMKGWQDYTTAKNLLKKPSMKLKSKEADRKELEKQVANYEKDHADVIAARGGKKSGPKTSNPTDYGNTEDNAYQAYKSGKITKEQYEGITGKKSGNVHNRVAATIKKVVRRK